MSDLAIRVENLGKRYRIGKAENHPNGRRSLRQTAAAPSRYLASTLREPAPDEIFWALKDVSFDACPEQSRRVKRGEVVGIPSRALDRRWSQRRGQARSCSGWLERC